MIPFGTISVLICAGYSLMNFTKYRSLCMFFELVKFNRVPYFSDSFHVNLETHSHNTRNSSNFHVPLSKGNNFGTRCFAYFSPRMWNSLPDNFKVITSFPVFKKLVKDYILRN